MASRPVSSGWFHKSPGNSKGGCIVSVGRRIDEHSVIKSDVSAIKLSQKTSSPNKNVLRSCAEHPIRPAHATLSSSKKRVFCRCASIARPGG